MKLTSLRVKNFLNETFAGGKQHGCWMCGKMLSRKTATTDHLIPQSLGGSDSKNNLRPCCFACNNERGNRELSKEEWLKARSWAPTKDKSSKRVELLAEAISRQRLFAVPIRPAAQIQLTSKEKPMRKLQLWVTEEERDLLETALKSLIEEADRENVGTAVKRVRGFVARRVTDMLARLEKQRV